MDFTDTTTLLVLLLVAIVGILIGYFLGSKQGSRLEQLKDLEEKNSQLTKELEACMNKLPNAQEPVHNTKAQVVETCIQEPSFDANAAKAAFGKRVKENDLKIVEGIGPKIESLFHESSITTWKALSETSVSTCQEILNSGGDRYRIHDPSSWPMQGKMASEGKWKALVKWQKEHKAGKF